MRRNKTKDQANNVNLLCKVENLPFRPGWSGQTKLKFVILTKTNIQT